MGFCEGGGIEASLGRLGAKPGGGGTTGGNREKPGGGAGMRESAVGSILGEICGALVGGASG